MVATVSDDRTTRHPATRTRRTVLYLRVSTDDQARDGNSLADQERAGRLLVAARIAMDDAGWTAITEGEDDIYADPGVSGTTRDRPGLNRLLADARAGKIGRVICTKLDRIGRTAAIILSIEDELDGYGVERTYIKDSIDTSTATGRLLRTVLAAVAELDREMILERTAAGRLEKIRKGGVWRGRQPYGYRYVLPNPQTKAPGRLEVDEDVALVVRRIFQAAAAGTSISRLAMELTAEAIPTPRGGRTWNYSSLRDIVKNTLYEGRPAYGRKHTVNVDGTRRQRRNPDEGSILYAEAPAIVSPALAHAARAQVARNRSLSTRNTKHPYMLARKLLRCGYCGNTMTPHTLVNGARRYECMYRLPTGERKHHGLPATVIEGTLRTALRALLTNPAAVLEEARAQADEGSTQAREAERDLRTLEGTRATVGVEQDRLLDLYLKGSINEARYTAKNADLEARRASLRATIDGLMDRRDAARAGVLPVDDIEAACASLARTLDGLTFDQWTHLAHLLCTSVVATRDEVHIEGALDGDLWGIADADHATESERAESCFTSDSAR